MWSVVSFAAYIQMHFRLLLIMEANTMNPSEQTDLDPIVCNIGYQSTQVDVRVEGLCLGLWERVN